MKCFRCFCCAFLVSVISLSVFSLNANAESELKLKLDQTHTFNGQTVGSMAFTPNNDTIEKNEHKATYIGGLPDGLYQDRLTVRSEDGNILAPKGRKLTLSLNNFYFSVLYQSNCTEGDGVVARFDYITKPDGLDSYVKYADGTYKNLSVDDVTFYMRKDKVINAVVQFIPEKDVEAITFRAAVDLKAHAPTYDNIYSYTMTFYSGEYEGDDKYQIDVSVASEELGLIEKILKTVTDVKDGIVELPQKIGNFIIEGIKSLFVPSDEFIVQFKDDLNALLSKKLGAVYQVIDILANTWDSIQDSAVNQSVKFPEVTINLPDDNEFKFGGYDVKVVPQGFEFIVDSVKLITGVIATLLFVNGLKKRYDEVMGG